MKILSAVDRIRPIVLSDLLKGRSHSTMVPMFSIELLSLSILYFQGILHMCFVFPHGLYLNWHRARIRDWSAILESLLS